MADIIDNNQFEKYEKMAVFICPNVRPNLVTTYEKYVKGRTAEKYIYENYIKSTRSIVTKSQHPLDASSVTLENIIAVCTYIALSKENIDQAIRTYRENRRVYKRNWFNSIKEEIHTPDKMRPKNPQLLRHYAESTKLIIAMDRSQTSDLTIEDIMQEKYEEIDAWRTDTSAPITDFCFLAQKPVKTLANGFVNDMTFESLIIIKDEFGSSIEGFNVRYPTDLADHPIFSYRKTALELEANLVENELTFLNCYEYENEDIEGEITVKYNPDVELPAVTTKKSVPKILKQFQIDLKQRELDMMDREIVTELFNMINGESLAGQQIYVDLRDFTRKVYHISVPKHKHYEDLGKRLTKLKNYDYTISVRSKETGELIETTTLGLLNYLYINFQENYFQYTPSDQLVRTYVQKKYISILTDSYTSINSPQTKGIMMILQQERLSEYSKNSFSTTLTLKYFRAHMKLQRMGNAALVKELTSHLTTLKKEHIVVKDFSFVNKNSAITIEFLPLDSKELIAYEFNTKGIEDKSNIIDAKYIDVTNKAGTA